ncbi:hypothetical protein [Neobacillus cucumis]|uniref:Uncharacterized protein n=1 Tax=Neobacillus cucumis TaxID=1740721 RepID=A0A2N5H8W0_9BACI|nr:hypothetical protein [Neobacillus cucumis]PLS01947.1 hypothetical protein CVD27_22800 [Neobacillus cucumis]
MFKERREVIIIYIFLPCCIREAWDWFLYYRRGKVKIKVYKYGNTYRAWSSSGKVTVWNCYGSTPEQARKMAEFRMKQALEEIDFKK